MENGKPSALKSKTEKELNKIAEIEKAIAKKFGVETIVNPKSLWTDDKEKEYLEQLEQFYSKQRKALENSEKTEEDGFLVPKNLITKESKRVCPVCETYSFSMRDDLYMNKYECCYSCFVQWVDDREERWLTGWRPNKEQN
jgi:anion-transporting  ArsA/GET3 family ATPase